MTDLASSEILILMIGFAGQVMFFMRFFVQWLYSENAQTQPDPDIT